MKKLPEAVQGRYALLPWAVHDSPAYTGASVAAKALLMELARQHNGANNGRLHLVHSWLAGRGWPSKSIVEKARAELIERGLIIQTKQGGMPPLGPSWYALTWLPISNYSGLDIASHQYHRGGWQFCNLPPTVRRKPPTKKRDCQSDHRDGIDPTTGAETIPIDPTTGAIKTDFGNFAAPTTGDDVLHHSPLLNSVCSGWRIGGWRWAGAVSQNHPRRTVQIFRSQKHA